MNILARKDEPFTDYSNSLLYPNKKKLKPRDYNFFREDNEDLIYKTSGAFQVNQFHILCVKYKRRVREMYNLWNTLGRCSYIHLEHVIKHQIIL